MSDPQTFTVDVPGAVLTYDVRPAAAPTRKPPIFLLGSPMAASGFTQLADLLGDRAVITYDPRGTERSTLDPDGTVSVEEHAEDYHRVVEAARPVVGDGPVDVFASSGGAVAALHWIATHPHDLGAVVAHEPPLWQLVEDRDVQVAAAADIAATYQRDGFGPAMAKFIQVVMAPAPLPPDYLDQPAPDPAAFGLSVQDDGSRDDLLLGRNMATMPSFVPDLEALRRTPVRLVVAHGEAGAGTMARRGAEALAAALDVAPVAFPGDHGGFAANEWAPDNDPAAFARRLSEVLTG